MNTISLLETVETPIETPFEMPLETIIKKDINYVKEYFNYSEALNIGKSINDFELNDSESLKKYIKKSTKDDHGLYYVKVFYEPKDGGYGREFAKVGNGKTPLRWSSSSMCSKIRNLLFADNCIDVDMVNCHPSITLALFNYYGLKCQNTEDYVNDRDNFLNKLSIRIGNNVRASDLKFLMISTFYGGRKDNYLENTLNIKNSDELIPNFDEWSKDIESNMKYILNSTKEFLGISPKKLYDWKREDIRVRKLKRNDLTSSWSLLCQTIELKILNIMVDFFVDKGFIINSKIYDGCHLRHEGGHSIDEMIELFEDHKEECEQVIVDKTGIPMKISVKPMEKEVLEYKKRTDGTTISKVYPQYQDLKKEFEKNHCIIRDLNIVIKKNIRDENVIIQADLFKKTHAPDFNYLRPGKVEGKDEKVSFIHQWFEDANRRKYDSINIYPNASLCPSDVFNNWTPFVMEKVINHAHHQEGLDFILNHIKSLCNFNEPIYDYFIKWIGQMIQYPEVKTRMITIISNEGTGKGLLLQLFRNMMGDGKVFETTDALNDIFGQFNAQLEHAFLVDINELKKKDMKDCYEKLKGLITDSALNINEKGLPRRKITSYHRFFITTNNEDPISTKEDDRRNLIIRASDSNIGNKEYFTKLAYYIDNQDVVKTCYEYFKTIPNLDLFNNLMVPKSDYQESLKELTKNPIKCWLESLVRDNWSVDTMTLTSKESYSKYIAWFKESYSYPNTLSNVSFGVRLANIQIKGVSKGPHTKAGESKIFNINELKISLNLLNIIEENN